jgi:hypothetical protein
MEAAFDVHIRKKDLAAFRRRVLYHYRKKPKHEYMEAIFIRKGVGEFHIESFHKLRLTKCATSPAVQGGEGQRGRRSRPWWWVNAVSAVVRCIGE